MLIHRTTDTQWLANAYVVAAHEGGPAIWIDGQGQHDELHEYVEDNDLTIELILLTHHHMDHLEGVEEVRERYGVPVCATARAKELIDGAVTVDRVLGDTETFTAGGLEIQCLPTPGHADGHTAFLCDHKDVFTGDVLFRGTVGGTRAPGHTTLADLRKSVTEVLLALPDATVVHPGHTLPTTIGDERAHNPFVRYWRGDDAPLDEAVIAWGEPATLLVWGPDYDGGNKALVRWADGSEDIVGGSKVERV